jgi:hypothetical protein
MERYHALGCSETIESAAATGDAEAARAWQQTLQNWQQPPGVAGAAEQLGLATPTSPEPGTGVDTWSDLLDPGEPGSADPRLQARVLHLLGEADAPPRERPLDYPDTVVLRATLGI